MTRTSARTACDPASCHDTFCVRVRHRSLRLPRTKEMACAARGLGEDSWKNRRNPLSMKRAASVEGWALHSPRMRCKRGTGKRESGSHKGVEWASAGRRLQSHDGSEGSGAKKLGREFDRRGSPAAERHPSSEHNLVLFASSRCRCRRCGLRR